MLIVGAGSHALEVLDVLKESKQFDGIFFFDDVNPEKVAIREYRVLKSMAQVTEVCSSEFDFVIAIGDPATRKRLYQKFLAIGGTLVEVKSSSASISSYTNSHCFDAMKNCFVGPNTTIGLGTLLNTGSQVHHDVSIGEFTEISPSAVLLGHVRVGAYSRIGANSTILPNIQIGSNVTVGAGSVVTRDLPDNCMAAGVPAVVKKELSPLVFA